MKILVIAPFVIIKEFNDPLVALAKQLFHQGNNILMVHCRQTMQQNCNVMLARGISVVSQITEPSASKELCKSCYRAARIASFTYPWKTFWLEIDNHRQVDFTKPNKKIWRFAGYEIVISQKIKSLFTNNEIMDAWKARYKSLYLLNEKIESLFSKESFDLAICYNPLYGINQIFSLLCEKKDVPFVGIHSSLHMGRHNEYILLNKNIFYFINEAKKIFKKSTYHISSLENQLITTHVKKTIAGNKPWAYSKPPSKLNNAHHKKNILILMSSPDELSGYQLLKILPNQNRNIFKNQIEWLKWVFSLSKTFPEEIFYIRPHPRIYPNKRENIKSPFGHELDRLRNNTNLHNVIWPPNEEQGSLWDHLKNCKLVLNAWSSASEIFSFYGIPVITFFPDYSNSGDLVDFICYSKNAYKRKISALLNCPKPEASRKKALKWLKIVLKLNAFNIVEQQSIFRTILSQKVFQKWAPFLNRAFCFFHQQKIDSKIYSLLQKYTANSHKKRQK